jgi:hypothetical protein
MLLHMEQKTVAALNSGNRGIATARLVTTVAMACVVY